MCKKCYVTTPIYYASGTPQLGNSYTSVACDVFARFNRLMKCDTFYLTGMDEHGLKIEGAAEKAGLEPQKYVDAIAEKTKKLWKDMNISYDYFIRTTDKNHVEIVQKIFEKMLANNDIYLGSYTGNYCVSCEAFFTKTQLGENETCPDCGKPTKLVSEESYFLNLKKYAPRLLDYIESHPDFIMPDTRRNEVVSFIKSGLEDLCVSRTTFKWGIPVQSNPKHVIYVWIDALANYITALGYDTNNDSNYQKYWVNNQNIYHVIGKDILRFHAIYWPIMLMSINVPINFKLIVHGWILNRDGKMSKSKGNAVYPEDLYSRYGSDSVRYYLTKEMPLGNDGLFSYDRFIKRYNTELCNDLGNLVKRSVAMIVKYFGGFIPNKYAKTSLDKPLEEACEKAIINAKKEYSLFHLQNALEAIWELINKANKYIDDTAPWNLAKDESKKDELASVMYHLAEVIRISANLVAPCLVETAPKMLLTLGVTDELNISELQFGYQYENCVKEIPALFIRLDEKTELAYFENKQNEQIKELTKSNNYITIDDFNKVNLQVGEIIASKRHEQADKLLVSQVKIGDEVRQIVSGIANYYEPSDLVGKKVIVVTNLKPVKIRGVESNGMVLCVDGKKSMELITVSNAESGSKIK